jgi:hypothetical protein
MCFGYSESHLESKSPKALASLDLQHLSFAKHADDLLW